MVISFSTKMAAGFDVASNNKSDKRAFDNNCCTDSRSSSGSNAARQEIEMLLSIWHFYNGNIESDNCCCQISYFSE